jgi:hypothetical protein
MHHRLLNVKDLDANKEIESDTNNPNDAETASKPKTVPGIVTDMASPVAKVMPKKRFKRSSDDILAQSVTAAGFDVLRGSYSAEMEQAIISNPVKHVRFLSDQLRQTMRLIMPMVTQSRQGNPLGLASIGENDSDSDGKGMSSKPTLPNNSKSMDGITVQHEISGMLELLQNAVPPEILRRTSMKSNVLKRVMSISSSQEIVEDLVPKKETILKSVSGAVESALESYSDKLVKMITMKMAQTSGGGVLGGGLGSPKDQTLDSMKSADTHDDDHPVIALSRSQRFSTGKPVDVVEEAKE